MASVIETHICRLCASANTGPALTTTSSVGSPDLDGRMPGMMRETLPLWVERCPKCGYCSRSIVDPSPGAAETVKLLAYREQLEHKDFPPKANEFLCHAMILHLDNKLAEAAKRTQDAAWVCDDENKDEAAARCRRKAIALILAAEEAGQKFLPEPESSQVVMVDLLRRSGDFPGAIKAIGMLRTTPSRFSARKALPRFILAILDFQEKLCDKRDTNSYTLAQAQA